MHELLLSGGQVGWWDVSDEKPHDRGTELTRIKGVSFNFFSSRLILPIEGARSARKREWEKDFLH